MNPDKQPLPTPASPGNLLRLPAMLARTGLGKSTAYALVASGVLSPPIRLSARAVAWRSEDVDAFIASRSPKGGAQ